MLSDNDGDNDNNNDGLSNNNLGSVGSLLELESNCG